MTWVKKPWIRFIVALLLIGIMLTNLDRNQILDDLRGVSLAICFLMVMVNFCLLGLFAKRWEIIGAKFNIHAPFSSYFRAIWASQFAGQIGPTVVMAEGTRFCLIHRYGGKWGTATSQVVDRISGQLTLFGMIVILSPFYLSLFAIEFENSLFTLIVGVLLFYLIGKKLIARVCDTAGLNYETILHALNPLYFSKHFLFSLLIQLLLIGNFGLAAFALSPDFNALGFFLLAPLIFGTLTLLPVSISDWGTREVSALLILNNLGMDAELIVSFSLLFGTINLLSALPGAFYLIQLKTGE